MLDNIKTKLILHFDNYTQNLLEKIQQIDQLWQALQKEWDQELLVELTRKVHSLHGSAGIYGYTPVEKAANSLEASLMLLQNQGSDEIDAEPILEQLTILKKEAESTSKDVALKKFLELNSEQAALQQVKLKKILIVEDERDVSALLVTQLQNANYDVNVAYDAIEGFQLFEQEQPDLLLLDISLPSGSGFTIAEKIRKLPHLANTPIIFLTVNQGRAFFERAIELGAKGFVEKPYNLFELLDIIKQAIKK